MDLPLIESRRIAAAGYSILESGFSDDIPYSEDYYEVRYNLLLITVLHMMRLFVVSPFLISSHMIVVFPSRLTVMKSLMPLLTGEFQILPAGFIRYILPSPSQR